MKWVNEGWRQVLHDEGGKLVCHVRKMTGRDDWTMYAPQIGKEVFRFPASSDEEARWRATLIVYNECNRIAGFYHKIRDNLPNLRELADDAKI